MKTQGDSKQLRRNATQEDLVQDQAILDLTQAIADRKQARADVAQERLDRQQAQLDARSAELMDPGERTGVDQDPAAISTAQDRPRAEAASAREDDAVRRTQDARRRAASTRGQPR